MYDKIIPLGYNCNVTFLLGHNNLKKESSLFEWFETKSFSDIIDVIEKLSKIYENIENNDINIIPSHKEHGVIIEKNSIYSAHYSKKNYREIFNRRCKRFFYDIKTSKKLLFVRVKNYNYINKNEMIRFKNLIEKINPNIEKINFLLIDEDVNKESSFNKELNEIKDENNNNFVIIKFLKFGKNKNTFKDFDKNIESIEKFSEIMCEFGYPKNISKYKRNDNL
jgi:hypothetical protein